MKIRILFFLTALLVSCNTAKNMSSTTENQNKELIDFLFREYEGNKPGASVLVMKEGEFLLNKSYGFADIKNNIKTSATTNYRIASVTKQFTAMAIMLLEAQGKINYETTLREVFPNFPKYGDDITIRHLITHRSGLINYNRFIEKERTEQILDNEILEKLMETDSTYFSPGSKYAYSNTGYAVLAQIIEKVSGVSFSEFMKREVFDKIDMKNTQVFEVNKPIENRAYGYIVRDTSITAKDQSISSAVQGDGGIYSSVLDYAKWDKALYTDTLLPQEKLQEAFYAWEGDVKTDKSGYGYGWRISYHNNIKVVQHGGSTTGFSTHMIRVPSEQLTAVIFTNRNKRGNELENKANALISIYSDYKIPMPVAIMVEKEIELNGIKPAFKWYEKFKNDTRFTVSEASLFYLGIDYLNRKEDIKTEEIFNKIIFEYPKYFGGYYGLAILQKRNGETEKAISNFKKTIEFASENDSGVVNYSKKQIEEILTEGKE